MTRAPRLTAAMVTALRNALELEKRFQGEPWVAARYRRTCAALVRRGLAEEYRVTPTGQATYYRITPAGRALVEQLGGAATSKSGGAPAARKAS